MASWRKRLLQMAADPRPVNYRYDDAVSILKRLGFTLAKGDGSHRKWRGLDARGNALQVQLVDSGNGPMKPVYIREMVRALRDAGLIPGGETTDVDE